MTLHANAADQEFIQTASGPCPRYFPLNISLTAALITPTFRCEGLGQQRKTQGYGNLACNMCCCAAPCSARPGPGGGRRVGVRGRLCTCIVRTYVIAGAIVTIRS